MDRFTDQERRFFVNHVTEESKQQLKVNQRKQLEALANPAEAKKIMRLQKELSQCEILTQVEQDF